MLLTTVVKDLEFILVKGHLNREISSVTYNSTEVKNNSVFVAISGFVVDGHNFVQTAIEMGATTIVTEKDLDLVEVITVLKVSDSRRALAKIAANFYNNPTEKLNLIGITGTNGKTSTTYFLKSIFEQAQKSIGLIGTTGTIINNNLINTKNTTPESLNLQQIISDMVDAKIDNCIMEVSSHALSLNRVADCDFNIAIFTNLSPDHLELHNNMQELFNAKAGLFTMANEYNIVNADDEYGSLLIERASAYDTKLLTYGIEMNADIYATSIQYTDNSSRYIVNTPRGSVEIKVNIPGKINVYNSLAAIACAYCNNIDLRDIQKGIENIKQITGRLEVVYQDNDYKIVIDFAHTEDGLEKVLTTLKPFVKGRLILVFGVYAAAGEKGTEKRRAMGRIAAKYADISIVTSDNPKDQDPFLIIKEVTTAIEESSGVYKGIVDREEAIVHAIEISDKQDMILIAGKGHETSQIIGNKEIPFNEKEIVLNALENKKSLLAN